MTNRNPFTPLRLATRYCSRQASSSNSSHLPNLKKSKLLRSVSSSTGKAFASSDISKSIPATPFSQPIPGFPRSADAQNCGQPADATDFFKSEVTTLSNGLRVATLPVHSDYVTFGAVVDAGSRYEIAYPSGITHFLQKLAFSATIKYESGSELHASYEPYCGIVDALNTKDVMIYACSCHRSGVDHLMDVLAETMLRPRLYHEEIIDVEQMIEFELKDALDKPERSALIHDLVHKAAFNGNTFGLPKICPKSSLKGPITREILLGYMARHYQPERIVIAGVGVAHAELVEVAQRHFVDKQAVWDSHPNCIIPAIPKKVDTSVPQYTGGFIEVDTRYHQVTHTDQPALTLQATKRLTSRLRLVVRLRLHQVTSTLQTTINQTKDNDFVAFCVLNSYLGGGASFSSGGPGKGLYTNLYSTMLVRYQWLNLCVAENHAYSDAGLFTISASCPPEKFGEMGTILVEKLLSLRGPVDPKDFHRAKKQLQSSMFMNMEARPVLFEDLGRQILGNGYTRTPQEFTEMIKAVNIVDIQRVAERMLSSKSSIVAYGDTSYMCDHRVMDEALATGDTKALINDPNSGRHVTPAGRAVEKLKSLFSRN